MTPASPSQVQPDARSDFTFGWGVLYAAESNALAGARRRPSSIEQALRVPSVSSLRHLGNVRRVIQRPRDGTPNDAHPTRFGVIHAANRESVADDRLVVPVQPVHERVSGR